MYVCICHALNDKQVKQALDSGARTPASVFRHYDRQIQCGKCVSTMRSMAAEHCANRCPTCPNTATPLPVAANADGEAFEYGIAAE